MLPDLRAARVAQAIGRCGAIVGPGLTPEARPSMVAALDGILPGGGLPLGGITEVLSAAPGRSCGDGHLSLLVPLLRDITSREGRMVALLDPRGECYPPALARVGVNLANIMLIRPRTRRDTLWALEECLRSQGLAATLGWLGALRDIEARRLQLAATEGKQVAVLFPHQAGGACSLRLGLRSAPPAGGRRRFEVEVLRSRGAGTGLRILLEVNDESETLDLSAVARLELPVADAPTARAAS